FADSTFFNVFSYQFLHGDPATALNKPKSIVLTEAMAEKYFGSAADAMGKVLRFSKNPHTVTGVFQNPGHSHMAINGLLSVSTFDENVKAQFNGDLFRMSLMTYVLLKSQEDQELLTQNLANFSKKVIDPWVKENQVNASVKYYAQPLTSIHLDNNFSYEISPAGNK